MAGPSVWQATAMLVSRDVALEERSFVFTSVSLSQSTGPRYGTSCEAVEANGRVCVEGDQITT